jgi:hypothetical protein
MGDRQSTPGATKRGVKAGGGGGGGKKVEWGFVCFGECVPRRGLHVAAACRPCLPGSDTQSPGQHANWA